MAVNDESIDREIKSQFKGTDKEKFELIKTVVAFANTRGGEITIRKLIDVSPDLMDSARLDDLVNRYIQPRFENVRSTLDKKGKVSIIVESSPRKPHIFTTDGTYTDSKGQIKHAFYPGQLYFRHSSKTEPATADDVHHIIRISVSSWLKGLAESVSEFSLRLSGSGVPVYYTDAPGALQISIKDVNQEYPYTAKTLGEKIGKNLNWVANAIKKLNLKYDKLYCCPVEGASGKPAIFKYSEEALKRLKNEIEKNPDFNPY